eukprot:Nitzschia sp. Nitz4//scaffold45_size130396//26616//27155//NITZ4_003435-RA/size130396-processed-gene-0.176-mRNA-1//1//CDS//3329552356//8706//frame0
MMPPLSPRISFPLERMDDENSLDQSQSSMQDTVHSRKRRRSGRSVRFSDQLRSVLEIPSVDAYTASEIQQTWINQQEHNQMRVRDQMLVKEVLSGSVCDEESHTLRGLENRFTRTRSERQQQAIVTVLEAQDEYWSEEEDEDDDSSALIASLYQRVSHFSSIDAMKVGLRDAWEAQQLR